MGPLTREVDALTTELFGQVLYQLLWVVLVNSG